MWVLQASGTEVWLREWRVRVCRSLPYEALLAQLSQTVGTQVGQGNLRYSLAQAFGEDASLKAQAYLGVSYPPPHHTLCAMLSASWLLLSNICHCFYCVSRASWGEGGGVVIRRGRIVDCGYS